MRSRIVPEAFRSTATVAASAEDVWARLTDWEGAPAWMAGIDALSASGPTTAGTELTFRARGKDRPSRIVAVDPGRSLVLRSEQGPVTADYRYEVESLAADRSRVVLVADCTVRGPMGLFAPLIRRTLARTDGGQPDALRALVEGG